MIVMSFSYPSVAALAQSKSSFFICLAETSLGDIGRSPGSEGIAPDN